MSIEVVNLNYVYSPGTPFESRAIQDLSCVIEDHLFLSIIGHTGSGKSTFIQHLNGLIKPTSGTVLFNGIDIYDRKKMKLKTLRQRVGLVFQYPEHQLFESTVELDVGYGPRNLGLCEAEIRERVENALEIVGLKDEHMMAQSPFELSGGQMRRVAIAGVLAMDPEILILDEPTAGLDPIGRERILSEIRKIHEEKQMAVILVSHSMEDVGRYADRIMVMDRGQMVMFDTPAVVFSQAERLKSIGLAVPEVTDLMFALKEVYPDIRTDIFTVEAAAAEILRVLGR